MLKRRELLTYAAFATAGTVMAACAPKAAPTAAPAAPAPAEKPPEAAPAEKAKIELRYMDRAGLLGDFMRHASRVYEEQNPHITVANESSSWGDLVQKVATNVAAGTMADLAFQHGNFMLPTLAKKGAWLDLTPAAERDNHDFSIYYPFALNVCSAGPTDNLVALPMGVMAGQNEMHWNVEMIQGMGLDEPHNKMSKQELTEFLIKVQEKLPQGSFATDLGFGNHFTSECHARSWGGYVISPDRKQCGFNMEKTQEGYKYGWELINKYHVVPVRTEIQEGTKAMFLAGTMATWFNCSANAWVGFKEAVGDKFHLGHCTWPYSEADGEVWGTVGCADATVVNAKTKYPDEAWGLCKLICSFEISKWTAVTDAHMTPGAVIEAWHDPEVWEACPPYKNCALAWDTLEEWGNSGVPYNTRRQEFDDLHDSEWQKMMYGEMEYNQASIDKLHAELKAIMDKPLP
jgi:ABC-type glycerol-3-phosphate transport system substrate-binding protein